MNQKHKELLCGHDFDHDFNIDKSRKDPSGNNEPRGNSGKWSLE